MILTTKKTSRKKIDNRQLFMGINVELEHTNSRKRAASIAKDHLQEDRHYYTHLKAMERKYKKKR